MFYTPKKNPTYLISTPSGHYFRLCVPKDLQDIVGKKEFRFSLRTGLLSEGKSRARLLAGLIQQLFAKIRSDNPSYGRQQIESMVFGFLGFVLDGSKGFPEIAPGNSVSTPAPGPRLKRLVKEYMDENLRSGRWSVRTIKEYNTCFNLFLFYFGDVPIGHISYKTMREYKDFLLKIPANHSKIEKYRRLSPRQLANVNGGSRLSVSAVNRYIGTVRSFLTYVVKNGYIEVNYASGMQLPPQKRPDAQRGVFSGEDLEKLFYSAQYLHGFHRHPYQFWLPLLGLLSGCRIEELSQLHVEDVRQVDDVWIIDINDHGIKRLKNRSSKRLVPLHPVLVEYFKFPDYVDSLGSGRLFRELKRIQNCYGHSASKWFGRYKKGCGIVSPPGFLVFHSFRHTLATELKQKQVPEGLISEFLGHAISGQMARYAKRFSPDIIYHELVLQIDYPLDFSKILPFR